MWFLQLIEDSYRHGESNPWNIKAKVLQAASQLNPDRGKISPDLNFDQAYLELPSFGL